MTLGSVMNETTRRLPPQFLQINGSVLNTRRIKLAHRRRRVLRWVACEACWPFHRPKMLVPLLDRQLIALSGLLAK